MMDETILFCNGNGQNGQNGQNGHNKNSPKSNINADHIVLHNGGVQNGRRGESRRTSDQQQQMGNGGNILMVRLALLEQGKLNLQISFSVFEIRKFLFLIFCWSLGVSHFQLNMVFSIWFFVCAVCVLVTLESLHKKTGLAPLAMATMFSWKIVFQYRTESGPLLWSLIPGSSTHAY